MIYTPIRETAVISMEAYFLFYFLSLVKSMRLVGRVTAVCASVKWLLLVIRLLNVMSISCAAVRSLHTVSLFTLCHTELTLR